MTGFGVTEEEFESLPIAVRRKVRERAFLKSMPISKSTLVEDRPLVLGVAGTRRGKVELLLQECGEIDQKLREHIGVDCCVLDKGNGFLLPLDLVEDHCRGLSDTDHLLNLLLIRRE